MLQFKKSHKSTLNYLKSKARAGFLTLILGYIFKNKILPSISLDCVLNVSILGRRSTCGMLPLAGHKGFRGERVLTLKNPYLETTDVHIPDFDNAVKIRKHNIRPLRFYYYY